MATQTIPAHLERSVALQYVISKGWNWRESGSDQIQIEVCPVCKKDNYHMYMACGDPQTFRKDGLWMCQFCGKSSNLRGLQESLGDRIAGIDNMTGYQARGEKKADKLPDVEASHTLLLEDADALCYLTEERGFSMETIQRQKLGLVEKHWFKSAGDVKALVIPYLVNGNCVFAKYRTLPPSPKDFISPLGWEAPLYNGEILQPGLDEIIFVEGEADALSLLSNGVSNVVGVPGANLKKTAWIQTLDEVKPERIYILYDNDKVGQKGAQELAQRIGIDKCLKLILPDFWLNDPQCEKCSGTGLVGEEKCNCGRPGKDVNEWFAKGGGTAERLRELMQTAQQFDVQGVKSLGDSLEDLEQFFDGKEMLKPTYDTPWDSLNRKVGFEDGDVIDVCAPEKVGKTTFALNLIDYEVAKYNEPGLVVCLEMTQQRLARKWVSFVTQTDDSPAKTDEEAKQRLVAMKLAIPLARKVAAEREADLYFCYPHIKEPEDIYNLIRQCVRRYGVKWVMFDNLQLLADKTLKNQGHRTIHLSQISKSFATLAKDLNIKLIRILQPRRVNDQDIASTNDVDGSSQIAKDCDCMIVLHRNRVGNIKANDFEMHGFLETEAAFEPRMLVNVGLSRYSSGGATTLEFDGGTSTVREFSPEKRPQPKANNDGSKLVYETPKVPDLTQTTVKQATAEVTKPAEQATNNGEPEITI